MSLTGGPFGAQTRYLGREAELDILQHLLEEAAAGRGGLVLLRGPAGTGTTRTAHEAAARADRLGLLVLWGSCVEGSSGRPYDALAEALEEFGTGLDEGELAAQLGADAPALTRLAPRLGQALAELNPAAPLQAPDERLRLHAAVAGWLSRAARQQPLLLVVDDVQWADGDLLRLLDHLGRRARRLPLLLLAGEAIMPRQAAEPGSGPAATELARLRSVLQAEVAKARIELPGLDPDATGAVLAPLADEPIGRAALELVQEVSGGEPLWARELYRHLREENRMDGGEGRGLPAAADLPETLEQLVAWRASRFGPEVRTTLAALAAFPRGATPQMLAQVAGLPRSRLIEFLEVGTARGLCRSAGQGQRHVISHDRLRLALLSTISAPQRAQLHRRIAETLEADLGDGMRENSGLLLHHYRLSGMLDGAERGIRHGLIAAEQARAAYADIRAAECLSACLELAAAAGQRELVAELAGRLGVALAQAGLHEPALASLSDALSTQRQLRQRSTEVLEHVIVGLRSLRDDVQGIDGQPAREELRRQGLEVVTRVDPLTRARLELLAEGWQLSETGSVRALVWSAAPPPVARLVSDGGSEADQAELLLVQRLRTREESSRAASSARRWRRPASVLRAMHSVAVDLLTRHGLVREAASWAGLYASTSSHYRSSRDLVAGLALLGRCQAVLGLLAQADESIAEATQLLDDLPEQDWLPAELLLTELVVSHLREGDWPALADRLSETMATAQPAGLLLNAELCLALARAGRDTEARVLLPDVLEACSRLPPLTYYRDAALISSLAAAWEVGAAEHAGRGRELLELAIAGQVGTQASGGLRLSKARMYGLAGDVVEARSFFAEERPLLEQAGLWPLAAILDHDEALVLAAGGIAGQAEATVLLGRAVEQFEQLGMNGWRQRGQALLERGGLEAALQPGGRLHFTYPLGLSRREVEMVRLVSHGTAPLEAARALGLDEEAARRHLDSALDKLGATLPDLPRAARRHGLGGDV